MTRGQGQLLRGVALVALVAAACPFALFGGAAAGCAGGGFNGDCATSASFIAPIFLIVCGIVASLLVRGWRGYLLVVVAVIVGMVAIFIISAIDGTILPFDLITGTLWTLWFLAPVTLGWVIGAVGAWLVLGPRGSADAAAADPVQPPASGAPPAG